MPRHTLDDIKKQETNQNTSRRSTLQLYKTKKERKAERKKKAKEAEGGLGGVSALFIMGVSCLLGGYWLTMAFVDSEGDGILLSGLGMLCGAFGMLMLVLWGLALMFYDVL